MAERLPRWAAALAHFDRERDERSQAPDIPDGTGDAPAVKRMLVSSPNGLFFNTNQFCESAQVVAVKATVDVSGSMQVAL